MPRRRLILLLVALLVLTAIVFPGLTSLITDWWWFGEVGFREIFTRELTTRVLLFVGVGGLATGFLFLSIRLAQRGLPLVPYSVQLGPGMPPLNLSHLLRVVALPFSLVIGMFFGLIGSASWVSVLQFLHRTPFGTVDPVFSRDIGFYVFTLPVLAGTLAMLSALLVIAILMLLPTYWLRREIVVAPPRTIHMRLPASRHIGVLLGCFFVVIALQLWFVDIPGLLYSSTGPLLGASYTDLHATLPALRLSAVVALAVGVGLGIGGFRGHLGKYLLRGVLAYIVVAALLRGAYPAVMQRFFVSPTELTRETPYLGNHLAATRVAWGIDSVELRELGDTTSLTPADIAENAGTVQNVRLWDRDPLLQTFGQLQEIRTYYDFISIDDDRYRIDGKYRQVLLSPRELNAASLPTRTFINEHLVFTHGMGLTLGPVNQVTSEGLPVLFVKDLPPASTVSLKVTRPQIYFGEKPYDYAIINTRQQEFDRPSGEANVYTMYTGRAGVGIGTSWRRLLFAERFGTSKILFSADLTDSSRILFYRNIVERVAKVLPFLELDRDPYMVLAENGQLKWMLDGYTATDRYPYSQRIGSGINYMRNSVKVVVDAYDGSIAAYVSAPSDPLIETWEKIFPGIFQPLDRMPADLRAHLRYPDRLYTIQTALYATYHMDSPEAFYQREDQWQVPQVEMGPDGTVPFMRHIVMRLPGEPQDEFVYMVPFTPKGKDNLAAWMVARNDGKEYGKLRAYTFSRQSTVYGPTQIENRINQNTDISRQVSLWDQRGSKVLRGDLLVIPIKESLLYVQPLYLQAEGGRIPELKRVVVAYQNQVVMEETLEGALADLFGGTARGTAPAGGQAAEAAAQPVASLNNLVAEAQRHYDAAIQAQRDGDWARYGDELKALGRSLEQLRTARGGN